VKYECVLRSQGFTAIVLAIAGVLFVLVVSWHLGFLASISILQIALQAAKAINFRLLVRRSGYGTSAKSDQPSGIRTIEAAIFNAAFALAGVASLTGLLHSGNLAGWLAIGAAAAGAANLIVTRRTETIPTVAPPSVPAGSSAGSLEAAPRRASDAMAMALVEVQRVSGGYTEHLHPFDVVIDEEVVGRLGPGDSATFEVAPGSHEIFAMIGWCRSERVGFQLREGQKVTLRCKTGANLLTDAYWATIGRRRYLRLIEVAT
jgi:hypothetical protein